MAISEKNLAWKWMIFCYIINCLRSWLINLIISIKLDRFSLWASKWRKYQFLRLSRFFLHWINCFEFDKCCKSWFWLRRGISVLLSWYKRTKKSRLHCFAQVQLTTHAGRGRGASRVFSDSGVLKTEGVLFNHVYYVLALRPLGELKHRSFFAIVA